MCSPSLADEELQQNVAAVAAAKPQLVPSERGEGMPRRRRNMGARILAQRRSQQAEEVMEGNCGWLFIGRTHALPFVTRCFWQEACCQSEVR